MKVLIIRLSALGDLVLLTGPIAHLKRQHPDLSIDFLTSEMGEEIFKNSIDFDNVYSVEKSVGFWKLKEKLRSLGPYDKIIDLQAKPKTQLLRYFTKSRFYSIDKQSKQRRSFVRNRKFSEKLKAHVTQKYYKTLQKAFNLEDSPNETLRPQLFANSFVYDKENFDFSNAIILHPYASQKNKIWPHTLELIEQLKSKGHCIVVIGHSNEQLSIKPQDQVLNLTNKTSVTEMISLIANGKALVSTDSGPMHLGIALKKPTLGIFGPTTKEFGFYPIFKKTKVSEITDLDCRPCHIHGGNECPLKHHDCMTKLTPNQVLGDLESLLKN